MVILKLGDKCHIGKLYFVCDDCLCEFIADDSEYENNVSSVLQIINGYKAVCPMCGNTVHVNYDDARERYLKAINDKGDKYC